MTIMMMTMSMMMMMMNISRHCWESRENQFVGRRKFSCSGTDPLFVDLLALTHYLSNFWHWPIICHPSFSQFSSISVCSNLSHLHCAQFCCSIVWHRIFSQFCSGVWLFSIRFWTIFAHPSCFPSAFVQFLLTQANLSVLLLLNCQIFFHSFLININNFSDLHKFACCSIEFKVNLTCSTANISVC